MTSHLILVQDGGAETLFTFTGAPGHERLLPALRSFLEELADQQNPRNRRKVFVYNLDEPTYEAWQIDRQNKTGRLPGELEMGMTFESAQEASEYLGYRKGYNRIAYLFRQVEEGKASIPHEGGVEWRYLDQMGD